MPDPTNTTPPPATTGLTEEQVKSIVTNAIGTSLGDVTKTLQSLSANQKVLADTIAQLPPAKSADPKAPNAAETPLTADAVKQLINDGFKSLQQQQTSTAQRQQFITDKLGKFPKVYQDQLGSDPSKWDDDLKSIQQTYEGDLKRAGIKAPDIAPPSPTGGAPTPTLDPSKLTHKQFAETFLPKVPGTVPAKGPAESIDVSK